MFEVECGFQDDDNELGYQHLINHGPLLGVQIGFDETFTPVGGQNPSLESRIYPALIDTGATLSCIDSELAQGLELPIVDREQGFGIGGIDHFDVHLAQIYVPSLNYTIWGKFNGVHLSTGTPYAAILGRTFLAHFTLVYEGHTGTVKIKGPRSQFR